MSSSFQTLLKGTLRNPYNQAQLLHPDGASTISPLWRINSEVNYFDLNPYVRSALHLLPFLLASLQHNGSPHPTTKAKKKNFLSNSRFPKFRKSSFLSHYPGVPSIDPASVGPTTPCCPKETTIIHPDLDYH